MRASRVLLAERGVHVGLFDDEAPTPRVERVESIEDWHALLVDEISFASRIWIDRALEQNVAVVIGTTAEGLDPGESSVIHQVLDGPGLAAALASFDPEAVVPTAARLAWTETGHPLAEGVAVTFPDPVGPLWAERAGVVDAPFPTTALVAPTNGRWRAATAQVTGASGVVSTYGVADDRSFFDGVVMAAAALAAADGAYPSGINGPGDTGGVFWRLAREAGLEVASFTPAAIAAPE